MNFFFQCPLNIFFDVVECLFQIGDAHFDFLFSLNYFLCDLYWFCVFWPILMPHCTSFKERPNCYFIGVNILSTTLHVELLCSLTFSFCVRYDYFSVPYLSLFYFLLFHLIFRFYQLFRFYVIRFCHSFHYYPTYLPSSIPLIWFVLHLPFSCVLLLCSIYCIIQKILLN